MYFMLKKLENYGFKGISIIWFKKHYQIFFKGKYSRKLKGGKGLRRKIIDTNLTSICCVYKEKFVKNYS